MYSYFSTTRDQFCDDMNNFDHGICAEIYALDEEEFYTYLLGKTPTPSSSSEQNK